MSHCLSNATLLSTSSAFSPHRSPPPMKLIQTGLILQLGTERTRIPTGLNLQKESPPSPSPPEILLHAREQRTSTTPIAPRAQNEDSPNLPPPRHLKRNGACHAKKKSKKPNRSPPPAWKLLLLL